MIAVCRESDLRRPMSQLGERIEVEASENCVFWHYSGDFTHGMNALVMEPGEATISKTRLLALLGDKDQGRLLLLRTEGEHCICGDEWLPQYLKRGPSRYAFKGENYITYQPPAPKLDLRARIEEFIKGLESATLCGMHEGIYSSMTRKGLRRILEETA